MKTRTKILTFSLFPAGILYRQFSKTVKLRSNLDETLDHYAISQSMPNTTGNRDFEPIRILSKNESFGACLMMKEDNDLLYEWVAYHFTVLPLRYIFVGSDEGNQQDPNDVLNRWENTGLKYWVVNASSFLDRHGYVHGVNTTARLDAHHSFVSRQRAFLTTCIEFMKAEGLHWVTFIDSDEFVVMNRVAKNENLTLRSTGDPKGFEPIPYNLRQSLPNVDTKTTILETINELKIISSFSPCYTFPRVLYGALENVTCPEALSIADDAKSSFNIQEMSTLRFHQHARKGDFSMSKYGKVMMDVSNLSYSTIAKGPRNIHRPYKPECRHAVVPFPEAVFYLNHYIGSWDRYNSRADLRRNRKEWEMRAHITSQSSCEHSVFQWFPRFLESVGEERARYLLGVISHF